MSLVIDMISFIYPILIQARGEIRGLYVNLGDTEIKVFSFFNFFGHQKMRLFNACISRVEKGSLVNSGTQ